MAGLTVESLQVASFETTPREPEAAAVYTIYEPICYSPRCAPTFGTNCQTQP